MILWKDATGEVTLEEVMPGCYELVIADGSNSAIFTLGELIALQHDIEYHLKTRVERKQHD